MTVDNFITAASVPVNDWHVSGTLDKANALLVANPSIASENIYTAAVLGDDVAVEKFLASDISLATTKGGPHNWEPLTYLCFSRFLRFDSSRSEGFVRAAKLLLDAGANANAGWYDTKHSPTPEWEPVLYGAAGIAHHPELTQLLITHGADPNDVEVVYHTPESYDNRAMKILLDTGKLTPENSILMLVRKHDLHDAEGAKMILDTGIDPNIKREPGRTAMLHAIQRDNSIDMIRMLLDHGSDPNVGMYGITPMILAAHRGRNDILSLFSEYGFPIQHEGIDKLIAACAQDDQHAIQHIIDHQPELITQLLQQGSKLLAEFAGTNNPTGLRNLLKLGIPVDTLYQGDGYFGIPPGSTALHVASWKASHDAVDCLIEHGADLNAVDTKRQTPLKLAIKACTDSYWMARRSTRSIEALIKAGASTKNIPVPTGYPEADAILTAKA